MITHTYNRNLLLVLAFAMIVMTGVNCSGSRKPATGEQQNNAAGNSALKKIVLIPGADSHGIGDHEHLGGCTLLARLLNEHVPGVQAIVTEQVWPKDTTVLEGAAAIVMYSDGGERHMALPHLAHLDRLTSSGTGLVNLHYAVEVPTGEAGNYFTKWVGGYFETHWSVNPFWTARYDSFPDHPITRGVKPFEAHDEWYYHMRFSEDQQNLVKILSALPPPSSLERPDGPHSNNAHVRQAVLERKEPQTTAWAYTRPGGGRGFGFTGAHVHNNWKIDEFRKLVLNAIVWSANIDVPAAGVMTPTPAQDYLDSLRKKEKPKN